MTIPAPTPGTKDPWLDAEGQGRRRRVADGTTRV